MLDDFIVGTHGDIKFKSKEEAEKDAKALLGALMDEHGKQDNDFAIKFYEVPD